MERNDKAVTLWHFLFQTAIRHGSHCVRLKFSKGGG
jgi:hypothetical protein